MQFCQCTGIVGNHYLNLLGWFGASSVGSISFGSVEESGSCDVGFGVGLYGGDVSFIVVLFPKAA